ARHLSKLTEALVVDMGGTSFDASLVKEGQVELKPEGEIARLRIALPMLDIVTIGAGGGSIGWIDAGGLLRMGPQSAGAAPGPACYGRGGELPTCTDANVVLGYLDPVSFAGGALPLQVDRARRAIEEHVARPLGMDVEAAAVGMYRVINANMAHGVREITVKRGLDAREFPMVVAGGAAGLHACAIAAELELRTVLAPAFASVLCATGMLMTDIQHDFVRSLVGPLAKIDPLRLRKLVADMIAEGAAQLAREGLAAADMRHEVALDLRYLKQYHEVTVNVARAAIDTGALADVAIPFHAEHDRLYGYNLAEQGTGLELINVRVRSIGRVERPVLPRLPRDGPDSRHALTGERRAWVPETARFATLPVYDGHKLRAGNTFVGPALVERTDTTLLVSAAFTARVDDLGTCVLELANGGAR
ncbi:MAG: hydantoinase/oxoprolinase family protein, partial [Deltaproteobacteria bacterium]